VGITHLSGLEVSGVPTMGMTPGINYFGRQWFVDTTAGSDGNEGTSPQQAFATMGRAFYQDAAQTVSNLRSGDLIWFKGTIREQLVAPLGVYGVAIIGDVYGGVRDDNGCKWTYPASGATAGGALLLLREQGWVVQNFLMTPEPTSGACIELRRAEDATYPDASHFIASGMRFVGIDVTTTYGIRDIGGCSNVQVLDSEFYLTTTGLWCSSTSIANPLRWRVIGNRFFQNTNDIIVPSTLGIYADNRHTNTSATEKVEISGGAGENTVTGCTFPDAAADIDPANGYDGESTDIWAQNYATDQAVFGNPS
jgi:hypothetical protein